MAAAMKTAESLHIYGIRHHGPGSARSMLAALDELQPDCLIVELPADAAAAVPLVKEEGMRPPVALLIYNPAEPRHCTFYPFAEFSPEWQAIHYALERKVPIHCMDLPAGIMMERARQKYEEWVAAMEKAAKEAEEAEKTAAESGEAEDEDSEDGEGVLLPEGEELPEIDNETVFQDALRRDPLAFLAEAAGFTDSERWWEQLVETREDTAGIFDAVQEAMKAVRGEMSTFDPNNADDLDALREAHMRKTIRAAQKEGFERIAIICGAWHGPALAEMPPQKDDNALLKKLPTMKTEATWVPWTYGRLARESLYGAGVISPAWYEHLWRFRDQGSRRLATRWLAQVASALRAQDLNASPAQVIDCVRLAESLASMRDRALTGLDELCEAAITTFLMGDSTGFQLIRDELIIGNTMGAVPDSIPMVPLQRDLVAQQKKLRMPESADFKDYVLDLRKEMHLERSQLLYRLILLDIQWGTLSERGGRGTFKEIWRVQWKPEMAISLIEASTWGSTIEIAAAALAKNQADEANHLWEITELIETALLGDLSQAIPGLLKTLDDRAAMTSDIGELMIAFPPMAESSRYGSVRKTDQEAITHVMAGFLARIYAGLGAAVYSLDDDAAERMIHSIGMVDKAVVLTENEEFRNEWYSTLENVVDKDGLHGLLQGGLTRMLLQANRIDTPEAGRRLSAALSRGNEPGQAAGWLTGFLEGAAMLLIHSEGLLPIIDEWMCEISDEAFQDVLPILRRSFSEFTAPERRMIGEKIKNSGSGYKAAVKAAEDDNIDHERAAKALPLLLKILGGTQDG